MCMSTFGPNHPAAGAENEAATSETSNLEYALGGSRYDASQSPPSRKMSGSEIWAWVALTLFLVGVGCMTFHPYLALQNSDGAAFYILAKSIISGQGYSLASLPDPQPNFSFPPFFPLQLAALMTVFQTTASDIIIPVAKWYELALFGVSLLVFQRALRPQIGWALGFGLTVLLAVNGNIHHYLGDVLSDIPYLLVSLLTLASLHQTRLFQTAAQASDVSRGKWHWISCGLLVLLILTRPVGLALGLAVSLAALLKRAWKEAILFLALSVLVFGGWSSMEHTYRTTHHTAGESVNRFLEKSPVKLEFLKYFSVQKPEEEDTLEVSHGAADFLKRSLHRSEQYGRMISKEFFPHGDDVPKAARLVFFILTLALVAFGSVRIFPQAPLLPLYGALYMGVLFAYPYVSVRYLIPVSPVCLILFFSGVVGTLQAIPRFAPRLIPLVCGLLALMVFNVQWDESMADWSTQAQIYLAQAGPGTTENQKGFYRTMQAVPGRVPAKSVVFTRKPEIFYLYTGVKAERYPFYSDRTRLYQWFLSKKSEYTRLGYRQFYILEDRIYKESRQLLTPMLEATKEQDISSLTLTYQDAASGTQLWQIP